jgi:hypothetical protein
MVVETKYTRSLLTEKLGRLRRIKLCHYSGPKYRMGRYNKWLTKNVFARQTLVNQVATKESTEHISFVPLVVFARWFSEHQHSERFTTRVDTRLWTELTRIDR